MRARFLIVGKRKGKGWNESCDRIRGYISIHISIHIYTYTYLYTHNRKMYVCLRKYTSCISKFCLLRSNDTTVTMDSHTPQTWLLRIILQ